MAYAIIKAWIHQPFNTIMLRPINTLKNALIGIALTLMATTLAVADTTATTPKAEIKKSALELVKPQIQLGQSLSDDTLASLPMKNATGISVVIQANLTDDKIESTVKQLDQFAAQYPDIHFTFLTNVSQMNAEDIKTDDDLTALNLASTDTADALLKALGAAQLNPPEDATITPYATSEFIFDPSHVLIFRNIENKTQGAPNLKVLGAALRRLR